LIAARFWEFFDQSEDAVELKPIAVDVNRSQNLNGLHFPFRAWTPELNNRPKSQTVEFKIEDGERLYANPQEAGRG
jgi:hypothetical protein